jgi:Zn-dependent protease with chaperone function
VRYWTLAVVLALSLLAILTLAGSLVTQLTATLPSRRARHSAAARAHRLFRLRTLPGLCGVAAGFGIALPIFLWFEDPGTNETVNRTLGLLASVGAWLLARGVWRAAAAWRSTARVLADWQRRSRPLDGFNAPLPVFAIDDAFPIVAVIGIRRPRLFVAERVLRECAPDEIAAMVSHECAHVTGRDNFKRLLMRACPGVFGTARLEREWNAAAEEAADAHAARGAAARLTLADALIHVARLALPQAPPLASAFYLEGSIDSRVRRLVDPCDEATTARWTRLALPVVLVLLALAIVLAAPGLYALLEEAVQRLP